MGNARSSFGPAVAISAVALACAGCGRNGASENAAPPVQPVILGPENVAVVEQRTLRAGPEISGTLRARREASIRAEVAGAVLAVLAESGERVKQGQVLARVDDQTLRDALLAARSALAASKNWLQVAVANARRARTLAKAGALAVQQAEQAEASLEAARAQVAEAQARVAVASQQVGRAQVKAPFAGVIAQRQVSTGDIVATGAPLFTVIDPSRLEFEASIPAARLGDVNTGARVEFSVTGFGDETFRGEIERIAPAVDTATGQVRVFVDVKNEDGRLISGLYAQGRVASRSEAALAAPLSAVDSSTTPPTVLRVDEGKVEKVPVKLGIKDEVAGVVAVTEGVHRGDVLVLGSARGSVKEGEAVRVAEPPSRERKPD